VLFNSFQFALFFAVVMGALVALPRRLEGRVLVAASLSFYALWVPSLLPLLMGLLAGNYLLVRMMVKSGHPGRYVAVSVVLTLSVLSLYKYGAFAAESLAPLVPSAHRAVPKLAALVLPFGISFYSFEIISLSVDIRHGRLPCPSFGRYVLFVTFFPHLVAGPIMRGEELLPQLENGGRRTPERTRRGLWLFAVGLLKKTLLSDFLLLPFVTPAFTTPGVLEGPAHLVAMYSFAFQIYFDFSGYSDMARGIACVLGYELPTNFEEPYLSRDPSEFWQRWHITLSRWLRDYLYVPLGGNRRGPARTLANLMITMLLGGLWHGAGFNFILWGGLHGLLLVGYRLLGRRTREHAEPLRWADLPRVLVMFHLVCLIWIPFRTASFKDAILFYRGLASGGYLHGWPILPLAIVCLCAALHLLERAIRERLPLLHAKLAGAWWGPAFEGLMMGGALTIAILSSGAGVQFIYFQF